MTAPKSTAEAPGGSDAGPSKEQEWITDYDELIEEIADTNVVNCQWLKLKNGLKYKIHANVSEYLSNTPKTPPSKPQEFSSPSPTSSTTGPSASVTVPSSISSPLKGLIIPPFPPRPPPREGVMSIPRLNSRMEPSEARSVEEKVFALMDVFEDQAPFTIQRICDLAIRPRQHYTTVGTYLRALERTLLITSTWDQYTLDTYITNDNPATIASNNVLRQATTPLFSPIPFLANRSESGSPPLSPLALDMEKGKRLEKTPPRVGLVDELDDLAPGHNHMADHPKALSSVTSLPSSSGESVLGLSLNERFTRSKTPEPSPARVREAINNDADDGEVEDMVLDDIEPSSERKEESSAANQNKES